MDSPRVHDPLGTPHHSKPANENENIHNQTETCKIGYQIGSGGLVLVISCGVDGFCWRRLQEDQTIHNTGISVFSFRFDLNDPHIEVNMVHKRNTALRNWAVILQPRLREQTMKERERERRERTREQGRKTEGEGGTYIPSF